jgi:hypothetical protein
MGAQHDAAADRRPKRRRRLSVKDVSRTEMASTSSFDALFDPGGDLLGGLLRRIEDRSWRMERITELPPSLAALVRLGFLKTRYDNGGLLYVFECDRLGFGRGICDALTLVGRRDGAALLMQAFDLFPSQAGYDDWYRRFAIIGRVRRDFDRIDSALGPCVDAIEQAACQYIRSHRQDYEHLRAKRPFNSLTDSYDDSGYDAG